MNGPGRYPGKLRRRIRRLFLAVAVLLPLQLGVVVAWQEFFPAFYMPMFAHVPGRAEELRVPRHEIHADDLREKTVLDMHALLFDMPESYRFHVMRHRFGYRPEDRSPASASLRRWLSARLKAVAGDRPWRRFSVVWSLENIGKNGGKEILGEYSIELEEGEND